MTEHPALSGRQVLVVEDEMLVSMLLEDMLADLGCSVIGPAATLDQAMALAADPRVEIAILDLNLDGRATYPVADILGTRGVPFVFATGYGAPDLPAVHGTVPILPKPFQASDLSRVLLAALQPPPGPSS